MFCFLQAKQAFSLNFAAKKRESFELARNKKSQNERMSVCDSCCSNKQRYCINLRCCFGFRRGSRLF
jgi:hypothetical protein